MTQIEDLYAFDKRVRFQVYAQCVTTGQIPMAEEVAQTLSCPLADVHATYQRLAEGKALVLQKSGEVLMAFFTYSLTLLPNLFQAMRVVVRLFHLAIQTVHFAATTLVLVTFEL